MIGEKDPVTHSEQPVTPEYTGLKDLHLETPLVRDGRPNVTIVAPVSGMYDVQANRIQQAIQARTGIRVPVATDVSPAGALPFVGHLILPGNRSTNPTISALYDRYYTLLDLRYPGPGGWVVRSLHNPFGNGCNAILIGGSDDIGVEAATDVFTDRLSQTPVDDGTLALDRLMEIGLAPDIRLPERLEDFEIWEASAGYGSIGYFGWNSISKRMAMYYMTGDPFHAREVVRLAFPDEQARSEIAAIDGERIENKDAPLSGPYHYNAHMMILFWDLIEESPVFSEEERLRITNAFARQFLHAEDRHWRRQIYENARQGKNAAYDEPPPHVGSRHEQWSAVAMYCLGRYFNTYYPSPLWQHAMAAARWSFSSLSRHAWVGGENDNLFWYNTGVAPILTYLLLTGDRVAVENGVLAGLLRGLDILISGREPDWALDSASIGFLHKAAHITGDGRYLTYLRRTGVDLEVFRLGQSFWPGPALKPKLPADLVNRWSIQPVPEPMRCKRDSGLPDEASFLFGSFRSTTDAGGDFILIKGMNGASRNPYHTFALLELRLDGQTVLEGYMNQLLIRADGLVEPRVAMDAALRRRDVIGRTAVAVGETPHAAFAAWQRTLIQRIGRYALVVDRLEFRTDSDDMEVEIFWQGKGTWQTVADSGAVRIEDNGTPYEIRLSDAVDTTAENGVARMVCREAVRDGDHRLFFSLIAGDRDTAPLGCLRLAHNAAALALPEPAIVASGRYKGLCGELVVLARDHLHGAGLSEAVAGGFLFSADRPVHLDWDFSTGVLEVVADTETQLCLALASPSGLRLAGKAVAIGIDGVLKIPAGRHAFSGAIPNPEALQKAIMWIGTHLRKAHETRRRPVMQTPSPLADTPPLSTMFTVDVAHAVVDLAIFSVDDGVRICAATGTAVHVLNGTGESIRKLQTDAPIRVLRWWSEHALLLAGCTDEKVIAFDPDSGARRWVFTSQMDPAVLRAAKTYWFKSEPGHEGIHGLHTGVFLDGESQAFVGSACTLEILDGDGKLVKRLPVFWGPGARFALIDGPEGSLQLLIARQPTDSHALAVVDNRTLDPTRRGFSGVPEGHTSIGGWACMSRKHIIYEDLNGDGEKEVVSEINGTWNRVTVWRRDGTPLHSANFGPGEPIPVQNVADLDVADLKGHGKKTILAALASGYVIALDHRCRRLWTQKLPSPPAVLKCIRREIWVGCVDGTVAVLDGRGEVIRKGSVRGRPTCIEDLCGGALLATETGQVALLKGEK